MNTWVKTTIFLAHKKTWISRRGGGSAESCSKEFQDESVHGQPLRRGKIEDIASSEQEQDCGAVIGTVVGVFF